MEKLKELIISGLNDKKYKDCSIDAFTVLHGPTGIALVTIKNDKIYTIMKFNLVQVRQLIEQLEIKEKEMFKKN